MTGVELVEQLRKRGIDSKITVLSAYLSTEVRAAYERMDVHVMFPKPFDVGALRSAVETSLPAAASETSLQPNVEPCVVANLNPAPEPAALAVIEEKSSSKRRDSHRRRAQGDRVR